MATLDETVRAQQMVQRFLRMGHELLEHPERAADRVEWSRVLGETWRAFLNLIDFGADAYGATSMMRMHFSAPPLGKPRPPGDHDIRLIIGCLTQLEIGAAERIDVMSRYARAEAALTAARARVEAAADAKHVDHAPAAVLEEEVQVDWDAQRVDHEDQDGDYLALTEADTFRFSARSLAVLCSVGRSGVKTLFLDLTSGEVGTTVDGRFSIQSGGLSEIQRLLLLQVALSPLGVASDELFNGLLYPVVEPRERLTKACALLEPQKPRGAPYKMFPNRGGRYTFIPPSGGHLLLAKYSDLALIGARLPTHANVE